MRQFFSQLIVTMISESEKIKNKRVSMQLSDIAKSIMRNIITDKRIQ